VSEKKLLGYWCAEFFRRFVDDRMCGEPENTVCLYKLKGQDKMIPIYQVVSIPDYLTDDWHERWDHKCIGEVDSSRVVHVPVWVQNRKFWYKWEGQNVELCEAGCFAEGFGMERDDD
jgi:hypothetical protein